MCVIIIKPRGETLPSDDIVVDCWIQNPHGAGYAICRDGETISELRKGFMDLADLLDALHQEQIQARDLVMIHFRYATSGRIDGPTCHPFPISDRIQDLRQLEMTCDRVMAHNGMIPNDPPRIMSDTQKFVLQTLSRMDRFDSLDTRIGDLIHGSRIAMIDRGVLRLAGKGWAWHKGNLFSNLNWLQEPTYTQRDWEDLYRMRIEWEELNSREKRY